MPYQPNAIKELAMLGANIEIADSTFTPETLKEIVHIVASKESHVTIHAKNLNPDTLREIATIGGKHVTLRV
jgi:imidazolonepropionase-like amidohydrolase